MSGQKASDEVNMSQQKVTDVVNKSDGKVTIMVRFSSREGSVALTFDSDDRVDILFKRLSEYLGVDIQYLTFTFNGKQYRHDSDDKRKRLSDIQLIDRSMIFVVSRVKGGCTW